MQRDDVHAPTALAARERLGEVLGQRARLVPRRLERGARRQPPDDLEVPAASIPGGRREHRGCPDVAGAHTAERPFHVEVEALREHADHSERPVSQTERRAYDRGVRSEAPPPESFREHRHRVGVRSVVRPAVESSDEGLRADHVEVGRRRLGDADPLGLAVPEERAAVLGDRGERVERREIVAPGKVVGGGHHVALVATRVRLPNRNEPVRQPIGERFQEHAVHDRERHRGRRDRERHRQHDRSRESGTPPEKPETVRNVAREPIGAVKPGRSGSLGPTSMLPAQADRDAGALQQVPRPRPDRGAAPAQLRIFFAQIADHVARRRIIADPRADPSLEKGGRRRMPSHAARLNPRPERSPARG